jgi:hypothetical protein
MKSVSKFSEILAVKREATSEPNPLLPEARQDDTAQQGAPGRPKAKRSDPKFVQTSPYIRRETLRQVKMQLLLEGQGKEYSELVEELLTEWLKKQNIKTAKNPNL